MQRTLIRDASLLTLVADGDDNPLGWIPRADVWLEGDVIHRVEPTMECPPQIGDASIEVVEADGRVLMPAFVDCHTHACWSGNRLEEWQRKMAGATYLELLESGGGIMATVRAVRAAAPSELTDQLMQRLNKMLKHGTTTVEIKSGYGLTTEDELKMLRAIHDSATHWPGTICPTACIGHALDPDVNADAFIERTIRETLPAITDEFPGITIDAYCEVGAWDLANTRRLLDAAQEAGHSIRVHADQFNSLGMIDVAISNGYRSVDHLEATDRAALVRLARSETCGVMLPCCGLHLDDRYGCGRAFLDAGGQLAIATNYNPGSAPCFAMPMVIALAVRKLGLTPDEAIRAATCNAAQLLATDEVGIIQAGKRADLVLLGLRDHRDLAFEFGGNPVDSVFVGGQLLQVG